MPIAVAAAKVICRGTLHSSEVWANVWHIVGDEPTPAVMDLTEATAIAAIFETFYNDLTGLLHPTWSLESVDIHPMPGTTGGPFSLDQGVVGINASDPLPNQDAIVLSLRTPINDRSHRGRIYLAGFCEDDNIADSSRLTSANRDVIGGAATDLSNSLQLLGAPNGPWNLAVYSRVLDDATAISGFRVGTTYDTQRRRRNRVNEVYASYAS